MRKIVIRTTEKIKRKLTDCIRTLPLLMMGEKEKGREGKRREREERHALQNRDLRSFHPHEVLGHTQTSQHRK